MGIKYKFRGKKEEKWRILASDFAKAMTQHREHGLFNIYSYPRGQIPQN